MEPIDIYNSYDPEQAKCIGRNVRILYNFAKFGRKGITKINPVTVYVDAIISVGEAVIAFYKLKEAKEVTKRLEMDLEVIKKAFNNKKKEIEEIEKNYIQELKSNKELIKRQLEIDREKWNQNLQPIYKQSKKYLEFLKQKYYEIKREYPHSVEAKDIENKLMDAIKANLNITIQIIGG